METVPTTLGLLDVDQKRESRDSIDGHDQSGCRVQYHRIEGMTSIHRIALGGRNGRDNFSVLAIEHG